MGFDPADRRGESTDDSNAPGQTGEGVSRRALLGGVSGLVASGLATGAASAVGRGAGGARGLRPDAEPPTPTVEGPIEGGSRTGGPQTAAPHDLDAYGYVEEEFVVAGEARHDDFFADRERAEDTAAYRTRILVYRPRRRRRFNGSVYAEWLNVSTQVDAPVAWPNAYDSLMRNGTAVALVSAQKVGVDDSAIDRDLVTWDPDRYGDLQHPGDQYALDIFAQAVSALARHGRRGRRDAPDPMGRLRVRDALATGHSQSAFFLLRYINLVAPTYGLVDGFVPAGSPLTTARADQAPILWFNSEDEAGGLGDVGDGDGGDVPEIDIPTDGLRLDEIEVGPRDDEGYFRLWEVAGASHVNYWLSQWSAAVQRRDFQGLDPAWDPVAAGQYGEDPDATYGECGANYFPARFAWRSALEQLREWVDRGDDPPRARRLDRTVGEDGGLVLERDEDGNAEGGLRLPPIDVPVATYDAASCGLTGRTVRFDEADLAERYPTHEDYVDRVQAATGRAVRHGHLRARDAGYLLARARSSPVGGD
jgi:hypothetical protein